MADRYWVGGTGSWNDTSHWSTTSGGASGASVPGASDNAILDGSSGGGTVTINVGTVYNLNASAFTGTLAQTSGTKIISGASFAIGASASTTFTDIEIASGTGATNVNTNNVNLGAYVRCTSSVTLQSAINASGVLQADAGFVAVDNSTNVTCNQFINYGSITMGSGCIWTCNTFTNTASASITPGTATLISTSVSLFNDSLYTLQLSGAFVSILEGGTITNLVTSATNTGISFSGGKSYTVSSITQNCTQLSMGSFPSGTFTLSTSANLSVANGEIANCTLSGTGKLIVTNGINAGGNSGNIFWNNNAGAIALF